MLNKKGFTVIELIMSFVFVSILTTSLFMAVMNYKTKEREVKVQREVESFKSKMTMEIENDIELRLLKNMEYCKDDNGNIKERCVIINFQDGTSKIFEIKTEKKQETLEDSTFDYTIPYILYGGVRYTPPDASNIAIKPSYILERTTSDDDLENNMALYRLRVEFYHRNIKNTDAAISIVALGTENVETSPGTYREFNVGDLVTIQINGTTQLDFYVIKKSSSYNSKLTLLAKDTLTIQNFNATRENGNTYDSSSISDYLNNLYKTTWTTPDKIRLITAEEVAYLVNACPKYMEEDASDLSIATAPSWVYDSSYWTSTAKKETTETKGQKVWYVNKDTKTLASDFVNSNHSVRPVIEVHKKYVTKWS